MSELIQEPKFISYENFIPNWTELVKEMDEKGILQVTRDRDKYAKEQGYDYTTGSQCLVGEGHKGNGEYARSDGCYDCYRFSIIPAGDAMCGGNAFDLFKREFYDHMIDKHPVLMVRRD